MTDGMARPGPSRRTVLRAVVLGGAVAAGGLEAFPSRFAGRALASARGHSETTLDEVLLPGARLSRHGGYAHVQVHAGESYLVRTDLGARAHAGRARRRHGLVAFAQLTDVHVVDAQSPARVEYLDRYSDRDPTGVNAFSAAWRPQEMLTPHVCDAMVRRINAIARGPVTRRRFGFAISTGDNVDNTQYNELRWVIDILDGERVRPDSGDLHRWEGVADGNPASYDVRYWHPAGAPSGKVADQLHTTYGFPHIPTLLDAARRPFHAEGLDIPWYSVFGNHDGLVQGNFPRTFHLGTVATGSVKVTEVSASPAEIEDAFGSGNFDQIAATLVPAPGGVRHVSADHDRRSLTREQTVAEHFRTTGRPHGHGFTARNRDEGIAYYTFDLPEAVLPIRGIVLDTVNANGYNDGSLDETQFGWLDRQLQKVHRRHLDSSGNVVHNRSRHDRLVVLFSHHALHSLTNPLLAVDEPGPRVLGPAVEKLLHRYPNVVLWVNGHSHVNAIFAHPRPAGARLGGGFWEVNTASHIDWPQQARLVELTDNRDGTLSVFGTIIDSAAPPSYAGRLDTPVHLAALARELAVNDPQERGNHRRGTRADRNVELLVAAPFDVTAAVRRAQHSSSVETPGATVGAPESSGGSLATTGVGAGLAVGGAALLAGAAAAARVRSTDGGPPAME
jgi:metallophosphoesterase (TIGR03767 family)